VRVEAAELGHRRLVLGARPRAAARRQRPARDLVGEDRLAGAGALGARAPRDELRDGAAHLRRRRAVALVHAQLAAAEAHHHRAVAREAQPLDPLEPEPAQVGEQRLGLGGRGARRRRGRRRRRGGRREAELQLRGAARRLLRRAPPAGRAAA
jgi:hypothetical protein